MFYDLLLFPSKISESVICHNFSNFQVLFFFFFSFFSFLSIVKVNAQGKNYLVR